MKTDIDICKDIYRIVTASPIKGAISGTVSYVGRADGSNAEDCVISVLESQLYQIQDCKVNVNVYVPDITSGGRKVQDVKRVSVLANLCRESFGDGRRSVFGDGFKITLENQRVLPVSGKDEHCINNSLRYKFNNE